MIDCYSRKLAGWAVADHMRTELVEDALKAACAQRGSLQGAIFHSDHGSVYTSKAYAKLCKGLGVTQSMGAVGTSADNSLAESFNATLSAMINGELPAEQTDVDSVKYWLITPEDLADAVVHVIDQPWGISISDITVRASGEDYLY